MTRVVRAHSAVTLIRVDGDPKVVFSDPAPAREGNENADNVALDEYTTAIASAFREATPAQVAEADPLTALGIAAKRVDEGGTIALLDSGLQTTAPLRFDSEPLLSAEPAEVADYLREEKLLPDLTGRTVLLVGIGETAQPQPKLDNRRSANLVATWKAVAEAAGACVDALDLGETTDSVVSTPRVAVVTPPAPPAPLTPCGEVELGEADNVSFLPDSAEFKDRPAARRTLEQLAGVVRDERQRVELVGRTASSGPEAGRISLSAQRADAVKGVLEELGVEAGRITTRGVGTNWPTHVPDIGPGGVLLPGPAAQNRKVVVKLTCEG
ncbi:OmpA family protein [Saccharothrix longispora]|uniref:Outer membrane protein OmpA-like peptidoglycan-associated protein n=2 Tax=Saccharothrix longispora TaxID=33920 RepID=A0ABU1Q6B1_9PSEU|nr:OmpA family protein [Saccharothrix longispora]MDR6598427.1 outer membrane protein OmpA-like peptidoglycan-associated protein [Saccharothrix longispora]